LSWVLDDEVLAVLAAIVIVSSVVAGVQVLYAGRVVEPFSELAILGPEGKIGNYPKEVVAGSPFTIVVYVGNHEGRTVYYEVLVKLGNKSSVVNETTPLTAEPIAELRTVLSHNSSATFPINLTLREPGTHLRLVFELWTFDEAAREFKYRGIWNQLWLNVTGQPSASKSTGPVKLSRELESKLADAYLAIRRAEGAGGDVSEMVGLLNRALGRALSGDEAGAEALASSSDGHGARGLEARDGGLENEALHGHRDPRSCCRCRRRLLPAPEASGSGSGGRGSTPAGRSRGSGAVPS